MHKHQDENLSRRDFIRRTGQHAALTGGLLAANTMSVTPVLAQAAPETPPEETAPATGLRVGWANVSITPDQPVQLAGQFHERLSKEGILYECTATALALESDGAEDEAEQAIMISCDISGIDGKMTQEIRDCVAERLPGFDPAKLFINATHTHTGPVLSLGVYNDPEPGVMKPAEYRSFFCERVTEAAVQAWKARKPGTLSHAVGHAAVGFCRIAVFADGTSRMYGKSDQPGFIGLEGGCDHGLELLFFWDKQKTLTGVVINIACPSQVVEGQQYLSADFWGPVREDIQREFGDHVFMYPMISAAGDQSPRDLVRRGRNEPNMHSEPGMREMGRRIINGVKYAYETAQSKVNETPIFQHHTSRLDLPVRLVTEAEAEAARKEIAKLLEAEEEIKPGSRDASMLRRAQNVIDRYEKQTTDNTFTMDLHVIRLGEIAIATNPFELYLEYGLRIKAHSLARQTLLVQLTNDRGRYLPTRRAIPGGAYGSRISDNRVGPEGGEILVETTIETINNLWTETA